MPINEKLGNSITDNAFAADNGKETVVRALDFLQKHLTWVPIQQEAMFKGVYYDSQKLGSYIIQGQNKSGEKGIIKIQLKPLDFDEGSIIRHISSQKNTNRITFPKILSDSPWNEAEGFGFIIFEDLTRHPDLWKKDITLKKDRKLHAEFLKEFLNNFLPVDPWFEKNTRSVNELYRKQFDHFHAIAVNSVHQHINADTIDSMKKVYLQVIDNFEFHDLHFTHGHLSGKDIKYDKREDRFVLMANIYWSYRQAYQEISFPVWVDIMHIRNPKVSLASLLERIDSWNHLWQIGLYDHDPTKTKDYWINLLERSMLTVMLDLGAGEWAPGEAAEKQALLSAWQELFYWIIENKIKK